jgi:hypothetical protein
MRTCGVCSAAMAVLKLMALPPDLRHDFDNSARSSVCDKELKGLLLHYCKTTDLVLTSESPFVAKSCEMANIAVNEARKHYQANPGLLRCLLSAGEASDAFAFWTSTGIDWIVLTKALLENLRDGAEDMASRLSARMPSLLLSAIAKRIMEAPPLTEGLSSGLASLLYIAGIAFFVGHEAGHHLEGHSGHFYPGAPAESEAGNSGNEIDQGLELVSFSVRDGDNFR